MGKSKAKAQRIHARRRFAQREFLEVTERDLDAMCSRIRNGNAQLVERTSNRVGIYDVLYEGRVRRVVYDRKRGQIVTVLSRAPKGER